MVSGQLPRQSEDHETETHYTKQIQVDYVKGVSFGAVRGVYRLRQWHKLTPVLEAELDNFLATIPGFHYFQSPAFFKVCLSSKKVTPFYLVAYEGTAVAGLLLGFKQVQIRLPVASFLSSRTIVWGGPVVRPRSPVVVEALLQFYEKSRSTSIYTQVRNLVDTAVHRDLFIHHGFRYEAHLTILVTLTKTEAALWQEMSTKRRNQIRRAEKEGCVVVQDNSLATLRASYAILQEVYQRAKLPLPDFTHFDSLRQQSDKQSGLRLFTVQHEGIIIGCMVCLAYGSFLFDYYAGAYSQHYKRYPNDLLPWAVFLWAKQQGFTHFDFGGAGKPDVPYGVRDYKKQFGGELVCFGRYERVHHPIAFSVVTSVFARLQQLRR